MRRGRSRAGRRSGEPPRGSPGRRPTRPGRPAAAHRPAERPRARRRTPRSDRARSGTSSKIAFGPDPAPLRGRVLTPPVVAGPPPGVQRRLLHVQAVLRVAGPVAEHPHPRPELRREGVHPQVRARTARMRQGHEVVVVDRGACPAEIDLRVHRVDRAEQLHRLVDEVRAQVEQRAPGLLGRRLLPPPRPDRRPPALEPGLEPQHACRAHPRPSAGGPSGSRRPSGGSGTRSAGRPGAAPPRPAARPSAEVAASGLSTTTGSPACTASVAIATCDRFGVATTTRSTSPESMSSSERSNSRVPG